MRQKSKETDSQKDLVYVYIIKIGGMVCPCGLVYLDRDIVTWSVVVYFGVEENDVE